MFGEKYLPIYEFIYVMDHQDQFCHDCSICWRNKQVPPIHSTLEKIAHDQVRHETKTKIFTPVKVIEKFFPAENLKRRNSTSPQPKDYVPPKRIRLSSYTPIEEKASTIFYERTTRCLESNEQYGQQQLQQNKQKHHFEFNSISTTYPSRPVSPTESDSASELDCNIISNERHQKEVEKAKYERTIKLYKFLIDLLEDNDPCVMWICRESGMFKIVDSDTFAKKWGEVKLNPTMNYEKLARSFRHYYKKGILESDSSISKTGKRKLYYKFGSRIRKSFLNLPN